MSQGAKDMLNMLWLQNQDSISSLWELAIQKRCDDPRYSSVLEACRDGRLSEELYNVLHGSPTEHCGSWMGKLRELVVAISGDIYCTSIKYLAMSNIPEPHDRCKQVTPFLDVSIRSPLCSSKY